MLLDGVLNNYPTKEITLRTDNGSQFIAHGLRKYLDDKPVSHEFTLVATPEENAYVESLFSNVERDMIGSFEFESIYDARDVFPRYFYYYNNRSRHHGTESLSPLTY
jgi:transposase InsO family protein